MTNPGTKSPLWDSAPGAGSAVSGADRTVRLHAGATVNGTMTEERSAGGEGHMSGEPGEIFTIGRGDEMSVVTIQGGSEQDTARITKAFQGLPGELLDNPERLVEVLGSAALKLRRDGKIDAETTIRTLRKDAEGGL